MSLVVVMWAVVGARTDMDTDLWWHLAYGRQLVAERTLFVDHTRYSWTPASQGTVYCAWISEIFLYLMFEAGGLALLYIFRYACLAVLIACVWFHARRSGVADHPMTWFICMVALLMCNLVPVLKPQIVSFVLMTGMVTVWMRIKLGDENSWKWCYAFPLLMVAWVNIHAAFVFCALYLAALCIGEELNALYSPRVALSLRVRQHLIGAAILAATAMILTPYGPTYPMALVRQVSAVTDKQLQTVREFDSIFSSHQRGFHLVDHGAISLLVLVVLSVLPTLRRRIDWSQLLTISAFAYLYCRYVRATIFWPPLFALTAISLLAQNGEWIRLRRKYVGCAVYGVVATGSAFLVGRCVYQNFAQPPLGSYMGYGLSYICPVEEADYIDKHFAGLRLGNDYSCGGYLLWRLWPRTKIFIDPRCFPYADWIEEYRSLETTVGIETFLRKYPCDVWCISLFLGSTVKWFLNSADWVPVFYGPSAVVFARRNLHSPTPTIQSGKGIDAMRNLVQGMLVLVFAMDVQDWPGAERILAGLEKVAIFPGERDAVAGERSFYRGYMAYRDRRYKDARPYLSAAFHAVPLLGNEVYEACLLQLAAGAWNRRDDAVAFEAAEAAVETAPGDVRSLYDAGVIGWAISLGQPGSAARKGSSGAEWRTRLERFLSLSSTSSLVPARVIEIARQMLAGTITGRPPLLIPPVPGATREPATPAEVPPAPSFVTDETDGPPR